MLMPEIFQQVKDHAGALCNTEPPELQDSIWQPCLNATAQFHLSLTKTSKPIKIK